jgi:hypothetical protein
LKKTRKFYELRQWVGVMTELEQRAQIEEAWARRGVFADAMAAERLADYIARRELGRLRGFAPPVPPAVQTSPGLRKRGEAVTRRAEQAIARLVRPTLMAAPHEMPAEKPANDALVAKPAKPRPRRPREDRAGPAAAANN